MKNTEKSSKSDNITLSKKDLEKIKSDMFEAGYLAGAQKLELTEKDFIEISLNLTQAAKMPSQTRRNRYVYRKASPAVVQDYALRKLPV